MKNITYSIVLVLAITLFSCNKYTYQTIHLNEVRKSAERGLQSLGKVKKSKVFIIKSRWLSESENIIDTTSHEVILPELTSFQDTFHFIIFNYSDKPIHGVLGFYEDISMSKIWLDNNDDLNYSDEISFNYSPEKKGIHIPINGTSLKSPLLIEFLYDMPKEVSKGEVYPSDFVLGISGIIKVGLVNLNRKEILFGLYDSNFDGIYQSDSILETISTINDDLLIIKDEEINESIEISSLNKNTRILSERQFKVGGKYYLIDTISSEGDFVKFHQLKKREINHHQKISSRNIGELIYKNLDDSNNYELSDLEIEEELIYIDFWGTWCAPCLAIMPFTKKMKDKYQGKIKFISANYKDDNVIVINKIINKYKIDWKQIMVEDYFLERCRVVSFPTGILVNKNMNIIKYGISPYELDEYMKNLK